MLSLARFHMNVIASKPIGIALFDATDLCVFVAIARFRLVVNFEVLGFMCVILLESWF